MPTYVYECEQPGCQTQFENNVPIVKRDDKQPCPTCGSDFYTKRIIAFTGLTWAPTAGGYR